MSIQISSRFAFTVEQPTSALLQFEVADAEGQTIEEASTDINAAKELTRVAAEDGIGQRIWLHTAGRIEVEYSATVTHDRAAHDLSDRAALAPHALPSEAVKYLLDSRYCRADEFQGLVASEFEGTSGGARIDAIRQWILGNFEYVPGSSDSATDASASFIKRQGICRDFAHVLVTLARASSIPARYVACYAPGVAPQDFHAVAQVYLADPSGKDGGSWHLVDATDMADLSKTAIIGVGRDAADVSFLTTFGPMEFLYSAVELTSLSH